MRALLATLTLLGVAGPHVAPLTFKLAPDRPAVRCTGPVPDSWRVAVWVRVDGADVQSASSAGRAMYYAGAGTLIKLWTVPHNGPICVRAQTWQPAGARVQIRFRVL